VTPNRGMGPPWGAFCQITLPLVHSTVGWRDVSLIKRTLQVANEKRG